MLVYGGGQFRASKWAISEYRNHRADIARLTACCTKGEQASRVDAREPTFVSLPRKSQETGFADNFFGPTWSIPVPPARGSGGQQPLKAAIQVGDSIGRRKLPNRHYSIRLATRDRIADEIVKLLTVGIWKMCAYAPYARPCSTGW